MKYFNFIIIISELLNVFDFLTIICNISAVVFVTPRSIVQCLPYVDFDRENFRCDGQKYGRNI